MSTENDILQDDSKSGRGCALGCLALFLLITVLPAFPPVKLSLIEAGVRSSSRAIQGSAVKAAWKQGKAGQQILARVFPEADASLRTEILLHLHEVQGTDVQKQGFPEPFLSLVPELLEVAATTESRWVTQNLDRGLRIAATPEAYGQALLTRLTTLKTDSNSGAHGRELAELAGTLPDKGRAVVLSRFDAIPGARHRERFLDSLMAKRPKRFGPATRAAIRASWPRWAEADRDHVMALCRQLGVVPAPLDELASPMSESNSKAKAPERK